jgi:cytochrome P450
MDAGPLSITAVRLKPPYGLRQYLRGMRHNQLELWWPEMFDKPLMTGSATLWRQFTVNDPDLIEHVLLTNQQNYGKSPMTRRILGPILGDSLLISEGNFWRRQRQIAAPAFHQRRIAAMVEVMADAALRMTERIAARGPAPFNLADDMRAVTLDIIVRTMFSSDIAEEIEAMRVAMEKLKAVVRPSLADVAGLPTWLGGGRKKTARAVAYLDKVVDRILAPRRADGKERDDLYAMLLSARDPETGEGMTDRQLRDEITTIFLAGHDTTSSALSWTWHLLGRHPDVVEKLREEVDRVLAGRPPTSGDVAALTYTKMVLQESMRLYPPAHLIGRTALGEDQLGATTIPAGSVVWMSPYITHRNPRLWPDPERFDPERFTPEAAAGRHRFAYFPFGGGPRVCIGNSFAMVEAQVILATMIQRLIVRPLPDQNVEPVAMVVLWPKNGIMATAEGR